MQNRVYTAILALSLASAPAMAGELDLTLGDHSLRAEYVTPVGQKVADNVSTLDLGILYTEDNNTDGMLAHAGLMIYGDTGARKANIQAGVGARVVLMDIDPDFNGVAVTLGGTVMGRLPDFNRLGGKLWMFYAPDVSSFGDLDSYTEYGLGLDYQLIRQAYVIGGYRRLRAGIDGSPQKHKFESSGYIGLRLVF